MLKSSPRWNAIPVVIFTTSRNETEIDSCYSIHANCVVNKPYDVDHFFAVVKAIKEFWLDRVLLPGEASSSPVRAYESGGTHHQTIQQTKIDLSHVDGIAQGRVPRVLPNLEMLNQLARGLATGREPSGVRQGSGYTGDVEGVVVEVLFHEILAEIAGEDRNIERAQRFSEKSRALIAEERFDLGALHERSDPLAELAGRYPPGVGVSDQRLVMLEDPRIQSGLQLFERRTLHESLAS